MLLYVIIIIAQGKNLAWVAATPSALQPAKRVGGPRRRGTTAEAAREPNCSQPGCDVRVGPESAYVTLPRARRASCPATQLAKPPALLLLAKKERYGFLASMIFLSNFQQT